MFLSTDSNYIYMPEMNESDISIFEKIRNKNFKQDWTDTSDKALPPPDFYNQKEKLMLEVMRVDDHAFEKRGKIINPTNQKAGKIHKELLDSGILDMFPNASLIVNAPTYLPTEQDHNYVFYKNNFNRVVNKHKNKISLYRKNHPNYKLIFFVYDESSMYCKVDKPNIKIEKNKPIKCIPHLWFLDKAFVESFKNSDIDYLIWFTPYKHLECVETKIELPSFCVFNCNNIDEDLEEYNPAYMISSEE